MSDAIEAACSFIVRVDHGRIFPRDVTVRFDSEDAANRFVEALRREYTIEETC